MNDEEILSLYRDHGLDDEYIETYVIAFARLIAAKERERVCNVMELQLSERQRGVIRSLK